MGIIFRSYAKKQELVPEVVERTIISIKQAMSIRFFDTPCFEKIFVMVPTDYDCGFTAEELEKRITEESLSLWVDVLPCRGHHSCQVLNSAMIRMQWYHIRFCLIMSHKAISYLTSETMRKVIFALYQNFHVVGVRIKELNDVQESPIQNTFAVWDIRMMPYEKRQWGFDSELGVEEVAPLIRLQKLYGKCAAVISAEGSLNIRGSEDGKARHKEVRDTKRARQAQEAARLGVTLEFVKENIVEL